MPVHATAFHGLAENRIWRAIVARARDITAWLQLLTFIGHLARR